MAEEFDAIVIGLGVMGLAVCRELACRGKRVLGIEQFGIAHDKGSSHGRSRVIRRAYFEDPRYVPLATESFAAWRSLEQELNKSLLVTTGCLNMGPPKHPCMEGVRRSVSEHQLPHELLDGKEISQRWPMFTPNPTDVGVYEPDAGYLRAEECVRCLAKSAVEAGAQLRSREAVHEWTRDGDAMRVQTDRSEYLGAAIVICAGSWLADVLRQTLALPLQVERQVQLWFEPSAPELFTTHSVPVFLHFTNQGDFYGIPPDGDSGIKAARHHGGQIVTPQSVDRSTSSADESQVRAYLATHFRPANGPLKDAKICLYTNTPDGHFIVDRHPHQSNVLLVGGFSGHGFKFAPVIGRMTADLLLGEPLRPEHELFSMRRFRS